MLLWGFFISTVLVYHGTFSINWFGHMLGSQRYDTHDQSRNNGLLAFITLGEGWHNNHHRFPLSARHGFFWWEFDPTWYALRLLSWTGLVHDLKGVPEKVKRDTLGVENAYAGKAPRQASQPARLQGACKAPAFLSLRDRGRRSPDLWIWRAAMERFIPRSLF